MWVLRTVQLMFLVFFVWALVFEVLIPLATQSPLFPMFRKVGEKAEKPKDRSKRNVK